MSTSEAVTRGVRVHVRSQYLDQRSQPEQGQWIFAYHIRITNENDHAVQLVSRHWIITDANGHEEEVRGPGVVGAQPIIEPGEEFEYSSFCPLKTSFGTMRGTYQMLAASGEAFEAEIAAFALNEPYSIN